MKTGKPAKNILESCRYQASKEANRLDIEIVGNQGY